MTILWNKNCAMRKKIQWKWNKLRGKWQYFICGVNHVGKEDKTPNLGPFTGNPVVKQIPSDPTKVWWIIELFLETTSLRCYARRLICIIFEIKENMIVVLRCWNGWMSVLFVQITKKGVKPGTSASSKYFHSTKRNVLRDTTASNINRSVVSVS
jgi:hypothetical protein